jgi:hypothetical protein
VWLLQIDIVGPVDFDFQVSLFKQPAEFLVRIAQGSDGIVCGYFQIAHLQ